AYRVGACHRRRSSGQESPSFNNDGQLGVRMSITSRSSKSGISSKVGSRRRRASKRMYAVAMATAAVPAVLGAQHAWANINTTTTDPFTTGNWGPNNGSAVVVDGNHLELTQAVNGLAGSMFF